MTRRNGIEFSLIAKILRWLTLKGGYTYLDATIRDGTFKGKDIPNVPRHKAVVELISPVGKGITFILNGIYIGERPFVSDFLNEFTYQKSYLILNSRMMYQWKSISVFLDINNLTDRRYSEYGVVGGYPVEKAFYPSPRINFFAGLRLNYK